MILVPSRRLHELDGSVMDLRDVMLPELRLRIVLPDGAEREVWTPRGWTALDFAHNFDDAITAEFPQLGYIAPLTLWMMNGGLRGFPMGKPPFADVQVFAPLNTNAGGAEQSATQWSKPPRAAWVRMMVAGGAGGGGGGRCGAISLVRCGGGGGGGGGAAWAEYLAFDLPSRLNCVAGAGGDGGVGRTSTNNGGDATAGLASWIGTSQTVNFLVAGAGTAGSGGTASTGLNGSGASNGWFNGSNGAAASTTGLLGAAASATPGGNTWGAGGGSGAGLTAANPGAESAGGAGGLPAIRVGDTVPAGGAAETAGTNGDAGQPFPATGQIPQRGFVPGSGGAGGGSSSAAAAGGQGGYGGPSAGGGGGGAALNGTSSTSGAGGKGGDGICVIVTV